MFGVATPSKHPFSGTSIASYSTLLTPVFVTCSTSLRYLLRQVTNPGVRIKAWVRG